MTSPPNPNALKQGDTSPLFATLSDANGPVDISGATIMFRMKSKVDGTGHAPIQSAAVNEQSVDPDTGAIIDRGRVKYVWGAGETDDPGVYGTEWVVTFGDASTKTFPNDRQTTLEIVPAATA